MPDTFHSCEITAAGISVRVLREGQPHRHALGVGDFPTRKAFKDAVAAALDVVLGNGLAAIVARAAAAEQERDRALVSEQAALTAKAAVEKVAADAIAERDAAIAERAILGTSEQAQRLAKQKRRAEAQAAKAAAEAVLAEPVDP